MRDGEEQREDLVRREHSHERERHVARPAAGTARGYRDQRAVEREQREQVARLLEAEPLALATRGAGRSGMRLVGTAIVMLAIVHNAFGLLLEASRYYAA